MSRTSQKRGWVQMMDKKYEEMIRAIAKHRDFGKRNPVDISMDLGYSETESMNMIEYLKRDSKIEVENKDLQFFWLRNKEKRYIVTVDINTWETKVISEIYGGDIETYSMEHNKFAYVRSDETKIIFWEDFVTGAKGKFLSDFDITTITALEDGIVAGDRGKMMKFNFDDTRSKVRQLGGWWSIKYFMEGKESLYMISEGDIYQIDKKLEGESQMLVYRVPDLHELPGIGQDSPWIVEVGENSEGLFGYFTYTIFGSGFFNTNIVHSNRKFVNGELMSADRSLDAYPGYVVKDVVSKNYQLLGTRIYKENSTSYGGLTEICKFDRSMGSRQIRVDFDRDIFIGVTEIDDEDRTAIIKIDLQNERNAVILPVEFPDTQNS